MTLAVEDYGLEPDFEADDPVEVVPKKKKKTKAKDVESIEEEHPEAKKVQPRKKAKKPAEQPAAAPDVPENSEKALGRNRRRRLNKIKQKLGSGALPGPSEPEHDHQQEADLGKPVKKSGPTEKAENKPNKKNKKKERETPSNPSAKVDSDAANKITRKRTLKENVSEVTDVEVEEKPKKKKKENIAATKKAEEGLPAADEPSTATPKEERPKFDYSVVLKALSGVENEQEAADFLGQEVAGGRLGYKDIGHVIRKWRQAKERKLNPRPDMKELFAFEGSLDELKALVTDMSKKGLIHRITAGNIVAKWKARETRRIGRQVKKQVKRVCLKCREPGHKISECPKMTTEEGVDICFKCGSTEHNIYKCPRKDKVKGFPYATCFICKQQGHLSRDCDDNDKGIYPDGGCCNICESKQHLIRDCPKRLASSGVTVEAEELRAKMAFDPNVHRSADDDTFDFEVAEVAKEGEADKPSKPAKPANKATKKVVKF
ncbi:unnamed protein product, partial [Mesorhabditis spiculigera]